MVTEKRITELIEEGRKYFQKDDLKHARQNFEKALEYPLDTELAREITVSYAQCLIADGDYADVIDEINLFIPEKQEHLPIELLNKKDMQLMYFRAKAKQLLGEHEESFKDLDYLLKAKKERPDIKLNSLDNRILNNHAKEALTIEKYETALSSLNELIEAYEKIEFVSPEEKTSAYYHRSLSNYKITENLDKKDSKRKEYLLSALYDIEKAIGELVVLDEPDPLDSTATSLLKTIPDKENQHDYLILQSLIYDELGNDKSGDDCLDAAILFLKRKYNGNPTEYALRESAKVHLFKAEREVKKENIKEAIQIYEKAESLYPTDDIKQRLQQLKEMQESGTFVEIKTYIKDTEKVDESQPYEIADTLDELEESASDIQSLDESTLDLTGKKLKIVKESAKQVDLEESVAELEIVEEIKFPDTPAYQGLRLVIDGKEKEAKAKFHEARKISMKGKVIDRAKKEHEEIILATLGLEHLEILKEGTYKRFEKAAKEKKLSRKRIKEIIELFPKKD